MELTLEVEYRAGGSVTYVAGLPELGRWEEVMNRQVAELDKNPFRLVDLVFLAWAAMKRESAGKQALPFELWRDTVVGIKHIASTSSPKSTPSEASEGQS